MNVGLERTDVVWQNEKRPIGKGGLFLLVVSSTFTLFPWVNDCQIMSRWLTGPFVLLLILQYCLIQLRYTKSPNNRHDVLLDWFDGFSYALIVVICVHFIISIGQLLGIIPCKSTFKGCVCFDNPAGFVAMIVAGIPFGYNISRHNQSIVGRGIPHLFCVVAIVISFLIESRSGIVSLLIVESFLLLSGRYELKIKTLLVLMLVLGSILAVFVISSSKLDSSYGRMLIIDCCMRMVYDSPLLGHGIGGFRRHYMEYQASYLDSMPDADIRFLADNVLNPLNEYVHLLIDCGLVGILVLILISVFLVKLYLRERNDVKHIAMASLMGIAILSLFSYPFKYPLTWIILIVDVLVLSYSAIVKCEILKPICNVAILLSCSVFILFLTWASAQVEWYKLSHDCEAYKSEMMVSKFSKLEHFLGNDPFFMYNQAFILQSAGFHKQALSAAEQSSKLMACYDTELLQADICHSIGDYNAAIDHLNTASSMCPIRFIPQYELFCLYREIDDIEMMIDIGDTILKKPIKVDSPSIRDMLADVASSLLTYSNP